MIPLKKFIFTPQTFKSGPRTSTPFSFNPRSSTGRQYPKVPKVEVPKVEVPKVEVPKVVVPKVVVPKVVVPKVKVPKVVVPEVPKVEVPEVHERGDEPLTWNMGKRKIPVPRSSCGLIAPPNSPRETWKDREIMTVYDRFKLLGKPTIDHWSQLDCFTEKDKAEGWTLESWDNFKWMDIEKEDYPGYSDEMELINNDQAESKVQSNQTSPTYLKCQVPPAEPNVAFEKLPSPKHALLKEESPRNATQKVVPPEVALSKEVSPENAHPKHQGHVISSSYSGGDINLQRSSENPPPYHEDEQFDIDDHFKQLEEIDKRIEESDKKLQMYMDEIAKLEAETEEIYMQRQNKKAQKTGENNEEDDKTPSRRLKSTASRWILQKWPVVLGLFATAVIICL